MIRTVQMDNLREWLGIRRMDKALNAWIRQLCKVTKDVDKKIDEGILWWFGHVKRMENDMIAKRVYIESVLVVTQWVGRRRGGLI